MTGARVRWLLLLLGALACAACGGELPVAPPHGLEIEMLEDAPRGEPIPVFTDAPPRRWRAVVVQSWTERIGEAVREGRAILHIDLQTRSEDGETRTFATITVAEAEGLGRRFVSGFDGLRVSVAHDESGRPDPATVRFEVQAAPEARTFLRGFWLAGLAGATPWLPASVLRVGGAWSRADLGGVREPEALAVAERSDLKASGGGRLESVEQQDGVAFLNVRLETLVELDAASRRGSHEEALSFGVRDRGEVVFRARDGMPIRWTLVEDTRLRLVSDEGPKDQEVTVRVQGSTTEVAPDDH